MIDFSPYLRSISQEYQYWWQVYTITDVVGKKQREKQHKSSMFDFFDLGLMVETVKPKQLEREQREEIEEKTEHLPILEGLRKYKDNHVLLSGKPGSGKSTALVRLLLEEANKIQKSNPPLTPPKRGINTIPVLVELRYYQTSILDLIKAFFQRHDRNLNLDKDTLNNYLNEGQFLLLIDGINELPSQEARDDLWQFRQSYQQTTPMIFTTRDLSVGGDFNIEKKLTMQSLTKKQMENFVEKYLQEKGEAMLSNLQGRLQEFGQTPLLLMMLCKTYNDNGIIPDNLGAVFRLFTRQYDLKVKAGVPVKQDSRQFWADMLQELAWKMTIGEKPTEIKVAIAKSEAEKIIKEWLQEVGLPDDLATVRNYLDDLLKYHLIQMKGIDQIEFHHQLIQEYYSAEKLVRILADLSDEELQWDYLNYIKWTEPIALMMALLHSEVKAVRVVKLALVVDYQLGARLAGEVKWQYQKETVGLVKELNLPELFKIRLLGKTKSQKAIDYLTRALSDANTEVRGSAAYALGEIGNETAVKSLINSLSDHYYLVRRNSAYALGKIGNEVAIKALIQTLSDFHPDVRESVTVALGKIGNEVAIKVLIKTLSDGDNVSESARVALAKIGNKVAIKYLSEVLNYPNYHVRHSAAIILGERGNESALKVLIEDLLSNSCYNLRQSAAAGLGKIGNESALQALIQALSDSDHRLRFRVINILGELKNKTSLEALIGALSDPEPYLRSYAVENLAKIGNESAIPPLIRALSDSFPNVRRRVVEALGEIGNETTIVPLIKALFDSDYFVFKLAAFALRKIDARTAVTYLNNALSDSDSNRRKRVVEALGEIGTQDAVVALKKVLFDSDSQVRYLVKEALRTIEYNNKVSIEKFIDSLFHYESETRFVASQNLYGFRNINNKTAIKSLIRALWHFDHNVRWSANFVLYSLGEIGNKTAIFYLFESLKNEGFVKSNNGDTFIRAISVLETIQEKLKYYNIKPELLCLTSTSEITIEEILIAIHETLKTMSDAPKYHLANVKELKVFEKVDHYEEHKYADKLSLSETAKEIQDLLKQLKEGNPEFNEEKLLRLLFAKNPTLKARLLNGIKEGGSAVLSAFAPIVNIPVQTIKGILEE